MPIIGPEEETLARDEWVRYQEMELKQGEIELRVDHFWHRIFCKIDECDDQFKVLPKMVKCALAHNHTDVDVERSLGINSRMLRKENTHD